jgi:hypothetical protein
MKRICVFLCCCLLLFSVCACTGASSQKMYIEPARLTEEEKRIAELLGLNQAYRIYDFHVDETVKAMRVNAYEWIDGEWKIMMGGGGRAFSDSEGRLALGCENIADELRIAVQSEHENSAVSYSSEAAEDTAGLGHTSSSFSGKEEIGYEREIPLLIQIVTSKNEVRSYSTDYFFQPEEYEKYGYEHVYAVTVLFSQKPLHEQ